MIYCVTSFSGVGCTFLDWSILFLSGQDQYYNYKLGLLPLSDDPLKNNNAHGHLKNHPKTLVDFNECIDALNSNTDIPMRSFYPYVCPIQHPTRELMFSTYGEYWDICNSKNIPIIFVDLNRDYEFLDFNRSDAKPTDIELLHHDLNTFFNMDEKNNAWNNSLYNNAWDFREFLALGARNHLKIAEFPWLLKKEHMYVNAYDLWFSGISLMVKIFDYLSLKIDASRIANWEQIYSKWQKKQLALLSVLWNVDHICQCIVENIPFDLLQFNLSIQQESIILRRLMKNYNLNIKGYGVEKFTNTSQLHKLLEKNIHKI